MNIDEPTCLQGLNRDLFISYRYCISLKYQMMLQLVILRQTEIVLYPIYRHMVHYLVWFFLVLSGRGTKYSRSTVLLYYSIL